MQLVLVEVRTRCEGKGICVSIVTVEKEIEKLGHARRGLCCKEINYATNASHALLAHCKRSL